MRTLLLVLGLVFVGAAIVNYATPYGTLVRDRIEGWVTPMIAPEAAEPAPSASATRSARRADREAARAARRERLEGLTPAERRALRRERLQRAGKEDYLDVLKLVIDALNLGVGLIGIYLAARSFRRGARQSQS